MCKANIDYNRVKIQCVVPHLVQRLRDGAGLLTIERWLFAWLLELGRRLLQAVFDALLSDVAFCHDKRQLAREALVKKMRSRGQATVMINSIFGALQTKTTHWVEHLRGRRGPCRTKRRNGGTGVYPVLWMLGVYDRCTPALQAEISRAMTLCGSGAEACALLDTRGISLAPKQVGRIAYSVGKRALVARDHLLDHADAIPEQDRLFAGKRIAVALDGGRYRARINHTAGRRTVKGRRGFETPWREPKGFIVYVLDDNGHMDKRFKPLCDFITAGPDDLCALLKKYLYAYGGYEATEVVFLGDGAHWIWNRVWELSEVLQAQGVFVTEVLDFYHVVEHLHALSALPQRWTERKRKMWVKRQRRALKVGDASDGLTAIEALAAEVEPTNRKAFIREQEYFAGDNASRILYADFKAEGLPIGSGAIESAIRRVINQRVKSNGIFWKPENAEAVMHMRAQLKTFRFDDMIHHATSSFARAA
jgi:hypothetical protein